MDKFGTKPIAKENQMNGGDEGTGGGTGTIGENEKQDGKFNLRQTKTGLTLLTLLKTLKYFSLKALRKISIPTSKTEHIGKIN